MLATAHEVPRGRVSPEHVGGGVRGFLDQDATAQQRVEMFSCMRFCPFTPPRRKSSSLVWVAFISSRVSGSLGAGPCRSKISESVPVLPGVQTSV